VKATIDIYTFVDYSMAKKRQQLPDEGIGPSAKRCLILSMQWAVASFGGCEAPRASRFDCFGTCTTESYIG
jgi:hypothetical protein